MRVVLAIVFAAGCGRIAFDPRDDAAIDAADAATDAPRACTMFGPFGAPVPQVVLNTATADTSPSLTDDGLTLYLSSFKDGDQDIYRTTRSAIGQPWATPMLVADLELAGDEEGNVEISGDELELYYGESQVFRTARASRTDPWPPVQLLIDNGGMFSSPQGPELSRDNLDLYFEANTTSGSGDIFVAHRPDRGAAFATPQAIANLNTPNIEGFASLSANGLEMFYSHYSADIAVFRATRPAGTGINGWVSTGIVSEIDDIMNQEDSEISADGTELYFVSKRAGGMGAYDIWLATRTCAD